MRHYLRGIGGAALLAWIIVGFVLTGATHVNAQTFSAQIQNFWNQLSNGVLVFAHLRAVDVTVTGTCTGCGGGPVIDGHIYNSYRGDGTFGHTFDRGTITTSDPFIWAQTWNDAGTTFKTVSLQTTTTAAGINSRYFEITNNGADVLLLDANNGMTLQAAFNAFGTYIQVTDASTFFTQNRGFFNWPSTTDWALGTSAAAGPHYTIKVGAVPALTSGWGAGATITGTNSVGRITIGAGPGAAGVLTFSAAWTTNAPHCDFNNETAGAVVANVVPTTALVTATGTFTAADKVSYHCIGWQ